MATNQSWDESPASEQSRVEATAQHQPQLNDLLKNIPPALLNQQCSKKFLAKVAKHLTKWRLLCPYLEMSDSDEDDIMEGYQGNELRKQKFLLQWHKKFGKKATHCALVRAIFDMGNVDLAWKVCQMAREFSVEEVPRTPSSPLVYASIPPSAMTAASTTSPSASSLAVATASPAMATTGPSPAMLSYRDQLRYGYRTYKPVMVVEWPPPPALKYINLAIIKKETVERGSISNEYIRTTIHGNMDDILHEKVPVEVSQLFSLDSDERKRKVVLVEGAPGSGKSTLLWHICQKWQSGELFQQFTLVLLVLLRDTHVHTAQSLADVLPCIPSRSSKCTPSEYRKTIASDIEDRHGEGVLILLDGWDEAPTNLQQKGSLIHDLIAEPSKCCVEAATVVMSSRPLASDDIRKYVSTRVEVLGFTKERREEYVQESLQDKPAAAHSLLQQIESNPELKENCYLPLNLVIITHTFMCSDYTLPSTYCRIIITLALSCLLRHIQKSTLHGTAVESLESFSDLPSDIREEFLKLCRLAYIGVIEEKYSFSNEDVRKTTQSDTPQITTFGLLQAVHSLVATGSSTVFHFLHLSLQELCAAYYISSLPSPETEHIRALKKMKKTLLIDTIFKTLSVHFKPVCKFYSALTHLNNHQVVLWLLHIHKEIFRDQESILRGSPVIECHCASLRNESLFECLLEAENPDLTTEIIGTWVRIRYHHVGQELASVIALALHLKSVSCEDFSPALGVALSGKSSLRHLKISTTCNPFCTSYSVDIEHVKHVLKTCVNLEHFEMDSEFGDTEISHLAEVLNQTSLQTLDLSGMEIGEVGIIALSSALKTNTTIRHLTVGCKDVGPHGQEALMAALSQNAVLNTFKIQLNHPGTFPADDRALFSCLKNIPSLTEFSIDHLQDLDYFSMILPSRSSSLSVSSKCIHMAKACLSATYVGRTLLSGNLVELADILKLNRPPAVDKQMHINLYGTVCMRVDFKNMYFVNLKFSECVEYKKMKCELRCEGEKQWTESLTKVVVKELDISGQGIGNTGLKHIANVMVMELLNVSHCGIGEDGMVALSSALSTNTTLRCLRVRGNKFGDKGVSHLAETLSHTPLQEIDISDCGIGEDGMEILSSALSTNTTLRCLRVRGNKFGDKGVSHLAETLSHTPLQEIDISDCAIGEDGMVALSSVRKRSISLKCLYAYGNNFGDKGATHLAMVLCHTSLQELDISDCGIGEEGMVALSSALSTNTTLKHLDIHGNNSRDEGSVAIFSALRTNTTLTCLDLSRNECRDKGITALSSALSTNTTLTHLKVSLELSGCSRLALAKALLQNTSLANLNDNTIGLCELDDSYRVFTEEVTQELLRNTTTTMFYTNINRSPIIQGISIDETSSLGEALWAGNMEEAAAILELSLSPVVKTALYIRMNNNTWMVSYRTREVHEVDEGLLIVRSIYSDHTLWSSLHQLSLEHLGGVGACLLAEILNETQIQELNISHCNIPEDGIVLLSQALSTNTTLEYLAIGGNRINECGQKALARALIKNTSLAFLDIATGDSFEDDGHIFFQNLYQFSLSIIAVKNPTALEELYSGWHGSIMDKETFRITLPWIL